MLMLVIFQISFNTNYCFVIVTVQWITAKMISRITDILPVLFLSSRSGMVLLVIYLILKSYFQTKRV